MKDISKVTNIWRGNYSQGDFPASNHQLWIPEDKPTQLYTFDGTDWIDVLIESQLGRWREDLTAWTTAQTTVNLTSQVFRDFGTTPVTVPVTITKTDAVSPFLSEFAFKFVFGTGGSFVWPAGVTLSSFSESLIAGTTYEAYILRGKIKYVKI